MAYVKPESALVQAAEVLLDRHVGRADGVCVSCGLPAPCETARHAAEVRGAAGLAGMVGIAGGAGTAGAGRNSSGAFGTVVAPTRVGLSKAMG